MTKRTLNKADYIVFGILAGLSLLMLYLMLSPVDYNNVDLSIMALKKIAASVVISFNTVIAVSRLKNSHRYKLSNVLGKSITSMLIVTCWVEVYKATSFFWGANWARFMSFNFLIFGVLFFYLYVGMFNVFYKLFN